MINKLSTYTKDIKCQTILHGFSLSQTTAVHIISPFDNLLLPEVAMIGWKHQLQMHKILEMEASQSHVKETKGHQICFCMSKFFLPQRLRQLMRIFYRSSIELAFSGIYPYSDSTRH